MSDDLIRRSDALKVLRLYGWTPIDGLYDTFAHDIPSADRPQGKWIRDRYWSRGVGWRPKNRPKYRWPVRAKRIAEQTEPQIFICPIQDDYEALIEDEPQMGDAKPIPLSNRVTHINDEPRTERSE